jgi:hypothetical protein
VIRLPLARVLVVLSVMACVPSDAGRVQPQQATHAESLSSASSDVGSVAPEASAAAEVGCVTLTGGTRSLSGFSPPGDITFHAAGGREVLRLRGADGALLWHGRVVETDPDLVAALREVVEGRRADPYEGRR